MFSDTRELIKNELEASALGAGEKVSALRRQMAEETDPGRRRVLSLKLEAAAQEEARLLQAFFATPRTL